MPKISIAFKIDKRVKEVLSEIATEEHRSLSNLVSKVLIDFIAEYYSQKELPPLNPTDVTKKAPTSRTLHEKIPPTTEKKG